MPKKMLKNLSVEELQILAAQNGIDLTDHYEELGRVKELAHDSIAMPQTPIDKRNGFYKKAVEGARGLTEFMSFVQIFVVHGIMGPALTTVLFFVELDRVRLGISPFDDVHAVWIAAAIMLAYVVTILVEAHYNYRIGNEETHQERFSLRKVFSGITYTLGLSSEKRYITQQERIRSITTGIQWLIVIAASFGSLQNEFASNETAKWYVRALSIFTDSNFRTFAGVVIMGLLAWMLLQALHWSLFRVHETVVNLSGGFELGGTGFLADYNRALQEQKTLENEAARMYLIRILTEKQKQLQSSTSLEN